MGKNVVTPANAKAARINEFQLYILHFSLFNSKLPSKL
jgi:hypothetical protein